MKEAVVLEHVTKSFKRPRTRRYSTLKELVIRGDWWRRGSGERVVALDDVSLAVPAGCCFGIVGSNGSGKSTLLRLIAGIYRPTSGKVVVNGRLSALLSLGLGFHPELSGRENALLGALAAGLTRREARRLLPEIVAFAELEDWIDAPVRTYSSGMYMRLAFSVAINVDPDVLLLDEILGVGDAHFVEKSRSKILDFKERGRTLILVSHALPTVAEWCDQAAWLEAGRLLLVGDARMVVARYKESVESP